MSSPSAKVQRGIAWLNENIPGWLARLNADTLNVGNSRYCILGQLHGDYFAAQDQYNLNYFSCVSLGFSAEDEVAMNTEWKSAIANLRNAAPKSGKIRPASFTIELTGKTLRLSAAQLDELRALLAV